MKTSVDQETTVSRDARIKDSTANHCPACAIACDLRSYRDATHLDWSAKRVTLSFAIVIAERHCPAYEPTQPTTADPERAANKEAAS